MENADPIETKHLSDEELGAAIEAVVREYLRDEGGVENAGTLASDKELWGHVDSLLLVQLLLHLQERFDVELNTGALNPGDLKTIGHFKELTLRGIRES